VAIASRGMVSGRRLFMDKRVVSCILREILMAGQFQSWHKNNLQNNVDCFLWSKGRYVAWFKYSGRHHTLANGDWPVEFL